MAEGADRADRADRAVEGFDHATIVVEDLEAAKDFLRLLGFVEDITAVASGPEMSKYMGIADWEADHVSLALEGVTPRQEVQLLRFHHPAPLADPGRGSLARVGFNHLCFRVRDLDAVLERLAAAGVTPRNQVLEYHDRRLVFLNGPAGVVVELAEWQPPPAGDS